MLVALCVALLLAFSSLPGMADAQVLRPRPNDDAAWAAGFAGVTSRLCGGYHIDSSAVLRSGGLYAPDLVEWADNGSAMLSFRTGGHAAEAAARDDPLFCVDPAASSNTHAGFVVQFLVRYR